MDAILLLIGLGAAGYLFWGYLKAPYRAPWQPFGFECTWASRSGLCVEDRREDCKCLKGEHDPLSIKGRQQRQRSQA